MSSEKKKPGRKPMHGIEKNVRLGSRYWSVAKKIGNGNASGGIRIALDSYDGSDVEPILHSRDDAPVRKSIKMLQHHWDKAWNIGEGNMAKGMRRALEAYPVEEDDVEVDQAMPTFKCPCCDNEIQVLVAK